MLGVSQETVSHWWTSYATGGLDAIPSDAAAALWAPAGRSRTSKPATSRTRSTTIALSSWASARPCEAGGPYAT